MADFYDQNMSGSFDGIPGDATYSVDVDTSKLEGAMDIFQNALHRVTDVLGRVVSGMQGIGSTVSSVFGGGITPGVYAPISPAMGGFTPGGYSPVSSGSPYQATDMSEVGRYVGYPTYFQSMKGAFGMGGSPFMSAVDYQQMMARDFAERTTLLGGSVASVGAEMGAGYLGAKMLKPLFGKGMFGTLAGGITGYTAAAYPLEHLMGKINQGLEFDRLIGDVSSRAGINEGLFHPGFNRSHRREITRELRGAGRDLNLGMGDFADIMLYGSEEGLFRGVTDSQQFTDTMKVAAKNLKSLMMVLREPDVREAIRDMATFQEWGVPLAQQPAFAQHAAVVGRMLGTTAKGAMQIASMGAQMGPQFGYSQAYGAQAGWFGAQVGESVLRSGAMTRAELSVYGGTEGFGNVYAQELMGTSRLLYMKKILPAFMKGSEGDYELDRDMWNKFLNDEIGYEEVFEEAKDRMVEDKTLGYMTKYLTPKLIEKIPAKELDFLRQKIFYEMRHSDRFSRATDIQIADLLTGTPEEAWKMLQGRHALPQMLRDRARAGSQVWLEQEMGKGGLISRVKEGLGRLRSDLGIPENYVVDLVGDAKQDIKELMDTVYYKMRGKTVTRYPSKMDMPELSDKLLGSGAFQKRIQDMRVQLATEEGATLPH